MFVLYPTSLITVNDPRLSKQDEESLRWHCRYGHLHFDGLKSLHDKRMVVGLPKITLSITCEACIFGKQARKPFQYSSWHAQDKLELVHTDLCGPMQVPSLGKSLYYFLFIDDLTRMCWVYFLANKYDVFTKFKMFKVLVEKECGRSIKVLRSDRGGEFYSKEFNNFFEEVGIRRELTIPFTPQHNGVVERKNRTVMDLTRSMLQDKELPNVLWAEGVATAIYAINRSLTKALKNQTPLEAWSGKKPSITHMKTFGCIAYGLIPAQLRRKLDNKSERNIFIGYSTLSKGYRLYNPDTKKFSTKRDVVFIEDAKWVWNTDKNTPSKTYQFVDPFPNDTYNPSDNTTTTSC